MRGGTASHAHQDGRAIPSGLDSYTTVRVRGPVAEPNSVNSRREVRRRGRRVGGHGRAIAIVGIERDNLRAGVVSRVLRRVLVAEPRWNFVGVPAEAGQIPPRNIRPNRREWGSGQLRSLPPRRG